MTEHSVKELRRQLEAADSAVRDAQTRRSDARIRLNDALIADGEAAFLARGITKGARVKSGPHLGIYVGHATRSYGDPYPRIMAIKKDGTAHASKTAIGFYGGATIEADEVAA